MSTTHFSKKFRRLSIRRDYANCARFQQLRFRSEMARRRPMQQAMLGAASGGLTRDASCTRPAANGLLLGVLEGYAYFRFACQGLPLPLRVPLTGPVIQARLADESYNARPWASTFEHGGADSGFRVHHDAVGREGGHWGFGSHLVQAIVRHHGGSIKRTIGREMARRPPWALVRVHCPYGIEGRAL